MDLSRTTMFSNRVMKMSTSVRQSRGVREYTTQYASQRNEALGVLNQLSDEMNHDIVGEKLQNWSTRRRLMKLPERPLVRKEEVLKILDQESDISDSWFETFASSCHTDNVSISSVMYMHASLCRRSAPREPRMGGVRVHWQVQRSNRATQMPQNFWMSQTPGMMMISMWWAPKFQNFSLPSFPIFENRDQRDQNTRIQQRLPMWRRHW